MAKTHFAASLWHIRFDGRDVKAVCGDVVKKAQLLQVWDGVPTGQQLENLNSLANCPPCIKKLMNPEPGEKVEVVYLYSCVEKSSESEQ